MIGDSVACGTWALLICRFGMGSFVRGSAGWIQYQFPAWVALTLFFKIQRAVRDKPSQDFHDLVAQPNPHGSYVRNTIRHHFPAWW